MNTTKAYDEYYLEGNIKLTHLLFSMFSKNKHYDALSLIDAFMKTSEIRKRMDEGNTVALYKGWKQLYNDTDKIDCKKDASKNSSYNLDTMRWMGSVYSTLQWRYCLYSKDISSSLPSQSLYALYKDYKEMDLSEACEKLYNTFLQDKNFSSTIQEEESTRDFD